MDEAFDKLERSLAKDMTRCIADFGLIGEGDRVMACLSGGKDSYTMLHLLDRAQKRAPFRFEIIAVHLDQGHPGYDGSPLVNWCKDHGHDLRVIREDTYSIVVDKVAEGKTYCSLCSRLRRGVLYNVAEELGCTKIALGHHADDAIETLMLNMFFTGSLGAMPPVLRTKDGRNTVIRPLLYCSEKAIADFAERVAFPILPCDLCGSQENLQRKQVKRLIDDLETRIPKVRESLLASLSHVRTTHLFDAALWQSLGNPVATESADAQGKSPFASGLAPLTSPSPSAPSPDAARRLPVL